MAKRDYYEILDVSRAASEAEMKVAYRKLAMRWHPDRNPGDKDCEAHFKEINEAYDVLKDEQKRAAYDRFGHAAFEQGGTPAPASDFRNAVVESVFGVPPNKLDLRSTVARFNNPNSFFSASAFDLPRSAYEKELVARLAKDPRLAAAILEQINPGHLIESGALKDQLFALDLDGYINKTADEYAAIINRRSPHSDVAEKTLLIFLARRPALAFVLETKIHPNALEYSPKFKAAFETAVKKAKAEANYKDYRLKDADSLVSPVDGAMILDACKRCKDLEDIILLAADLHTPFQWKSKLIAEVSGPLFKLLDGYTHDLITKPQLTDVLEGKKRREITIGALLYRIETHLQEGTITLPDAAFEGLKDPALLRLKDVAPKTKARAALDYARGSGEVANGRRNDVKQVAADPSSRLSRLSAQASAMWRYVVGSPKENGRA